MLTAILSLLAAVTASMHIRAEYRGPRLHVYLFKPLTTVLILLVAVDATGSEGSLYSYAIIAGLVCSLAGDLFLMLPSDRFVAGLVSFLVAHLFYTVGFISGMGFSLSLWALLPLLAYGVVMFSALSPHLGRMKLPVSVYMGAILVMAWQAWERWVWTRQQEALLAAIGAVLFLISDSALALNRFRGQYRSARALTLGTYFAAQWLIALSVGQAPLS
jgi:uncharacterized membrane protein YhhN